ncbi:MAG: hypothetical protein JRF35_06620 [Deltaproteobacteria bacterium]|nr:hypothetical protein [Deltaproteobacteria bacterium]
MKGFSGKRTIPSGIIEVDLFSEEVDSEDHPEAAQFKEMLEEAASDHGCELMSFKVNRGTVSFSFDDDVLTAKILNMFHEKSP